MKIQYLFIWFFSLIYLNGLTQYDTTYHPFYEDHQLIEITPASASFSQKGFIQTDMNDFSISRLPRYVLRDEKGKIVRKYNFFQSDIDENQLRHVQVHSDFEKPHQLKTKNTSNYIGNDDSGYNVVYPVFECSEIEGGKCIDLKIGLIDTLGKVVLPVKYEKIQWVDSVFITQYNDKYSLYSHDFKLLLADYQLIEYINTFRDHILLKNHGKYGLVHRSGKNLLMKEYDIIRDSKYMHGRYEFLKNGLWGFVDHTFTSFLEPFSPTPNLFLRDGYFQYYDEGEKWNVIDSSGQLMLKCHLQMYQVISPDRFLVYNYKKDVGYERSIVDSQGKMITNEVYYDLWRINQNTLIAGYDAKIHDDSNLKKSTKWVLLDQNGQFKTETEYKSLHIIDANFLGAWTGKSKMLVIDSEGNDVLGYEIEDVYKYEEHLYKIKVDNKHQFLDLHDPRYVSKKYDELLCVKENRIGVRNDGLWGFMDARTFREILPTVAEQIICFQNGLACYKLNNKWIIIDSLAKRISNDLFTNVQLLENGFVKVEINGKYGIINRIGKYVIPLIFDQMKFVIQQEGKSFIGVRRGDKYGIINLKNELIYPFIFESCAELTYHATVAYGRKDGYYAFLTIQNRRTVEHHSLNFNPAKDHIKIQPNPSGGFRVFEEKCSQNPNGKCFGVINWDGIQVIPPIYAHIKDLRYNTFEIATKKGLGLADTNGRIIIPPVHKYMYELSGDSSLLQVGRHQGPWGLYTRNGQQLADTIYGGFEKPIYSLIPFYANFNHRVENNAWVRDPTKIGFMNRNGEIVIPALYDRYYVDSPKKGLIQLMYQDQTCVINGEGELMEGRFSEASPNYKPANNEFGENEKSKKKLTKRKKKKVRWL